MGTPSGATPSRGMGKGFFFYYVIMSHLSQKLVKSRRHGRNASAHYAIYLRRVLRRAGDQAQGILNFAPKFPTNYRIPFDAASAATESSTRSEPVD